MGVHFDYKKNYRQFLYWNITTTVVSVILGILTYSVYKHLRQGLESIEILMFFVSYFSQHLATASVQTTYVTFIYCLHQRFHSLNLLLRLLFSHLKVNFFIFITFNFHFTWHSDEFLSKRAMPIHFRKQESIAFIKFTGKMHALLTEIMEELNRCYSMQVVQKNHCFCFWYW